MEQYIVTNNEKLKQFEIEIEGEKAYLTYRFHEKNIALMHTFVPNELEGRGIASALAQAAFKYAEERKMPVMIYCPFVSVYLKKHPELNRLVDPEYAGGRP